MDASPGAADPRQPIGLQDLPYDVFEKITDFLPIEDVNSLNNTVKTFRDYIQANREGFLRGRLVRQCAGFRPLCFLALLYYLYEHYGIPDRYQTQESLGLPEVSFAVTRLRSSLAIGSGQACLSDTLESMKERQVLQVLCECMDTIDDLIDDFFTNILSPFGCPHEMIYPGNRLGRRAPQSPPGPELALSRAERARFQEGFLANEANSLLSKSEDLRLILHYKSQLSALELERATSAWWFLRGTWKWMFAQFAQREQLENRGVDDPCQCCGTIHRPGCRPFSTVVLDFTAEGVLWMRWGRKYSGSYCCWEIIHGRWANIPDRYREQYSKALSSYHPNFDSNYENPVLSPGEEQRQEAEVTRFWKIIKDELKGDIHSWYKRGADEAWRKNIGSVNTVVKEVWSLWDFHSRGWVFLHAVNFDIVTSFWDTWVTKKAEYVYTNDFDLAYFLDFQESLHGAF